MICCFKSLSIDWLFSWLWVTFSSLFTCHVFCSLEMDIVNFTLSGAGVCCISLKCVGTCSPGSEVTCGSACSFWGLVLRWWRGSEAAFTRASVAPLLKKYVPSGPSTECPGYSPSTVHSGWWELESLPAQCDLQKLQLTAPACSLPGLTELHLTHTWVSIQQQIQGVPSGFLELFLCVTTSS